MRRRRGSAFSYCLILLIALTSVMLATVELTVSTVTTQKRAQDKVQARLLFEGAVARTVADRLKGTLSLGTSRALVFGTLATSTKALDHSGTISRTLRIDSQTTLSGKAFKDSAIVGVQDPVSPWYYSLFVDGAQELGANLTVNSPGDVYLRGAYVGGTGQIISSGDVESVSTINKAALGGTPNPWENQKIISFPGVNFTDYRDAPNYKPASKNINGAIFALTAGRMIYVTGPATIRGIFAGNGTIYVKGDATIDGNISVIGGKLAIIVEGDLDVDAASVEAFLYSGGEFDIVRACTITGAIVTDDLDLDQGLTLNFDSGIWDSSALGTTLKLPGFWP